MITPLVMLVRSSHIATGGETQHTNYNKMIQHMNNPYIVAFEKCRFALEKTVKKHSLIIIVYTLFSRC